MKFSEIEYKRPDVAVLQEKFEHLINLFEKAESFDEQDALIRNINDLRMEFQTLGTIASIKYSIDTNDKEFESEQEFYDANSPIFDGLVHKYYTSIVESSLKKNGANSFLMLPKLP
jgi:oligoendopeptidase F